MGEFLTLVPTPVPRERFEMRTFVVVGSLLAIYSLKYGQGLHGEAPKF